MADRKLWSWGSNAKGQLGQGDVGAGTDRSSPEQVGALNTWSSIGAGDSHTLVVKTDGTIWSWGDNVYGELGLGDEAIIRSSPEQVGALTNWSSVVGGVDHVLAVKTDGSLWSWGRNLYGQLGQGDRDSRSSPEQVGSLTDWSSATARFYHTIAVKTDGTLWAWGFNDYGESGLGQDEDTKYSSPMQIGSLTDWYSAKCGYYHTVAIKTDGTIWAWGYNMYGQLGQEDIEPRSSPEQVGSLTDWSFIDGGDYHVTAIKTDGSLWSLGYNTAGQLGLEDVAHRSSPEQVGSLTTWSYVTGGSLHVLGIQGPIEIEDVVITLSRGIGEWCWGHITDVEEANLESLSEGTGTGTVSGTGDAERLTLLGGETWTLPAVQTGLEEIEIEYDKYENLGGAGAGSGGPGLIEYRTGATEDDCEAAGWNTYTVHFTSLDWVQVRMSNFN